MNALEVRAQIRARDLRAAPACATCTFFSVDPLQIEAQLPGLNALSSGFASVRGGDGLCARHQRLLRATSFCANYSALPQFQRDA
ncbi:MAG TPA: hypothetical protein VIE67_07315 [Rudaea sp.]|jgi:hypothetical protein|uniref:hypothetical protein n=1 Tax=Rudaea sp. TaxID=2136325 RepID=UPI002F95EE30